MSREGAKISRTDILDAALLASFTTNKVLWSKYLIGLTTDSDPGAQGPADLQETANFIVQHQIAPSVSHVLYCIGLRLLEPLAFLSSYCTIQYPSLSIDNIYLTTVVFASTGSPSAPLAHAAY